MYIYIYQHIPGRSTVAVGNYQQWWVWAATNQLQSGESPPLLLQSPMMHLKTWCRGDPLKTFSIFRPDVQKKFDCQCCVIELSQTTTSNMGEPWNIGKKKTIEQLWRTWSYGGLSHGSQSSPWFFQLKHRWRSPSGPGGEHAFQDLGPMKCPQPAPGNLEFLWQDHRDVPNFNVYNILWCLKSLFMIFTYIYHIYVRYFKLWAKARCRNTLVHTRRQPHSSLRCWKQPKWVGQPRNYENHGEYHIEWRCQK